MFYKNIFKIPKKLKYSNIEYDFKQNTNIDDNIKNNDLPILNINFSVSKNMLTNSYGESKFYCAYSQNENVFAYPEVGNIIGIKDVKYFVNTDEEKGIDFSEKKIIVQDNNNCLYYSNLNDGSSTVNQIFQFDEGVIESKMFKYYHSKQNYLLISAKFNENNEFYVFDTNFHYEKYDIKNHIFDICSHNNMMFVVFEDGLRNKICYTTDSHPYEFASNFNNMIEIGVPQSKGKIMKIMTYNDYLYVVCEYGIIRIVSYKTQEELFVEDIYSGTARVIENSVVQAGDNIMFADINNIYMLDGTSVEKIEFNFSSLYSEIAKWKSFACFNDGKYYLSTRINYFDSITKTYDDEKNNSLIVYDLENKSFEICSGISIEKMEVYYDESRSRIAILAGENRVYGLKTLSKSGLFNSNVVSEKVYQTSYMNFGTNDTKLLKNIRIATKEDIVLKIDSDGKIFEYKLIGKNDEQCIVTNLKTKLVSIIIESKTLTPEIKNLKMLVGKYE